MGRIGAENSTIVTSLILSDQARKGENIFIINDWQILTDFTWVVVVLARLEAQNL